MNIFINHHPGVDNLYAANWSRTAGFSLTDKIVETTDINVSRRGFFDLLYRPAITSGSSIVLRDATYKKKVYQFYSGNFDSFMSRLSNGEFANATCEWNPYLLFSAKLTNVWRYAYGIKSFPRVAITLKADYSQTADLPQTMGLDLCRSLYLLKQIFLYWELILSMALIVEYYLKMK